MKLFADDPNLYHTVTNSRENELQLNLDRAVKWAKDWGGKCFIIQSTPVISKSKDPLKHFEISVLRHIRFVVLKKKKKTIRTTKFHK